MAPTVKRLVRDLDIDVEQATAVRGLIKGDIDPETITSVADWLAQCYNRPSDDELILCAIDSVLGTFGTEAIWDDDEMTPAYAYCNTGDGYNLTIMWKREEWGTGRFIVAAWADIAERNPKLH